MIYYSNNSCKLGTNDPKNVGLKIMNYGNYYYYFLKTVIGR